MKVQNSSKSVLGDLYHPRLNAIDYGVFSCSPG
jgi:hypothetical protein